MENFHFYQDSKVKCWVRTHFIVKADSREDAEEIVRGLDAADVETYEDGDRIMIMDYEALLESVDKLSPDENEGRATIETYYASDGTEIINNEPAK